MRVSLCINRLWLSPCTRALVRRTILLLWRPLPPIYWQTPRAKLDRGFYLTRHVSSFWCVVGTYYIFSSPAPFILGILRCVRVVGCCLIVRAFGRAYHLNWVPYPFPIIRWWPHYGTLVWFAEAFTWASTFAIFLDKSALSSLGLNYLLFLRSWLPYHCAVFYIIQRVYMHTL